MQEEFEDVMWILHQQATSALRQSTGDPTIQPLYIYDNVGMQTNASHTRMGFSCFHHVVTPTHSPDFNKPIEHSFNQIKSKLLASLNMHSDVELTPQIAQKWVADTFLELSKESLQKDILSLHDTWLIVSSNADQMVTTSKGQQIQGSGGDYISSPVYR